MKIITLLQIRSLSSRLPFKALLRISNIPSAILLYKRITSPRNYKTVILTSDDKSDDFLAKVLQHHNVKFSRGNLPNVKKRFLKYLEKYNDNDLIVRVTGDNIFVDRNLIKICVNNFLKRKKEYLYTNPFYTGVPLGISVEVFRLSLLRRTKDVTHLDKEHVTYSFDKSELNSVNFIKTNKNWKNLNCSIDYMQDYQKIKNIFQNYSNPLTIKWNRLCDVLAKNNKRKLSYKKKYLTFSLKSYLKKDLSKKIILSICKLKEENWKFGIKSQLDFFNRNTKKKDIHNLLFYGGELVGYTLLKRKKYFNDKLRKRKIINFYLLDTFVIKKEHRNNNFGDLLMCYNNNKIINYKLPALLICNKKLIKFYTNNFWRVADKNKKYILKIKYNQSLLTFNF